MNLNEICKKDRELQRKGLYNTLEMKNLHEQYSKESKEKELLKKLLGYKEYVKTFCR